MNTIKNPEIQNINPIDFKLNSLWENSLWNIRTVEFCKSLDEEKNNALADIFAKFLNPQEIKTA